MTCPQDTTQRLFRIGHIYRLIDFSPSTYLELSRSFLQLDSVSVSGQWDGAPNSSLTLVKNHPMNLDRFARFFVRFNGLCFLFWAVHELFDFPYLYSSFTIAKETGTTDSILARGFYVFVGKLSLQLLAAALLLLRTDKVITFVLTGKWRLPPAHGGSNETS
jgi:hypothetical protein